MFCGNATAAGVCATARSAGAADMDATNASASHARWMCLNFINLSPIVLVIDNRHRLRVLIFAPLRLCVRLMFTKESHAKTQRRKARSAKRSVTDVACECFRPAQVG